MRLGVPSLTRFAERMSAVRSTENSSGRTVSHDNDAYKYVIWDWLDSLDRGWSSVDGELGQEIFRLHSGECIAFSSLPDEIRTPWTLLSRALPATWVVSQLIPAIRSIAAHSAAIVSGAVVQERSIEGDKDWPLQGAEQFRPRGLAWKDNGWLASKGPRGLSPVGLSERGAKASANVAQKQAPSVETRAITAIDRSFFMNTNQKIFEFESVGDPSDVLQGIMAEGKFTKFLFDREHKKGGSRAPSSSTNSVSSLRIGGILPRNSTMGCSWRSPKR
jgi:hypothetical protein